jgi:hypothetical protein
MRYAVALHERIMTVTDTHSGHSRAPKAAKRGTIKGISSKSRYRLIKTLAQISRPDEPVFITLTYRDFSTSFEDWKSHLHNFRRRIAADFPDYCGLWRLEFQERGAPHYHILAWLAQSVSVAQLRDRLADVWTRVIGQETAANHEHGVEVAPVTDFRQTAFYISLYQAKDKQDRKDIDTGREWGFWKKERLGLKPIEIAHLDGRQFLLLRRTLRRSYVSYMRRNRGGTVSRSGAVVGRGRKAAGSYLRALRRNQPFSNFLPFYESRSLVEWVRSAAPRGSYAQFCRGGE